MTKKRNRCPKRRKRKQTGQTAHASLAGFAPLIESKGRFDKIHQRVSIGQKQLIYRPTDKLIFVVLGLLVGCEHIDEINHRLRPDKVLLNAFGYASCADQSVIQDTLDDCVKENVVQLKGVLRSLYLEHNQSQSLVAEAIEESKTIIIDMDLTGRPVSQNAEGAKKGYFSGRRGIYGRQLARVLLPDTQEIIAEELSPGNRLSPSKLRTPLPSVCGNGGSNRTGTLTRYPRKTSASLSPSRWGVRYRPEHQPCLVEGVLTSRQDV